MSTDDDERTGAADAAPADGDGRATAYPSLAPAGFVPRIIRPEPEPERERPLSPGEGALALRVRRALRQRRREEESVLLPMSACDLYFPGHTPHFVQWRLARDSDVSERRTIVDVADDGTITFAEGEPVWNHDPERLRAAMARFGRKVTMGSHHIMHLGGYCFSVGTEASPCVYDFEAVDDDGSDPYADESIVEATLRKGGALLDGRAVLAQMERRGALGAAGDDPE